MGKRILIVDDEPEIRKALSLRLEHAGYSVTPAENGGTAIRLHLESVENEEPFDLIILDIMMPDVDGVQVLAALREDEKRRNVVDGQQVQILMLTALKQPWMEMESRDLGCDDYLIKPYGPFDLLRKIEEKLKVPHPI